MKEEKRRNIRKYAGTRLLTPRPLALQLRHARMADRSQQGEMSTEVRAQERDSRQASQNAPAVGRNARERATRTVDRGVAGATQKEEARSEMEVGALAEERSQVIPISAQLQEVRGQLEAASRAVSRASALLMAWSQEGSQEASETQRSDGSERVHHAQSGQVEGQTQEKASETQERHTFAGDNQQAHFQGAFRRDRFRR
ncbi:MAG: hypothetical protein IMW91_07205 [Firmicutes bacterium]|nr:hypothetical protein [Bacillota bacterium]